MDLGQTWSTLEAKALDLAHRMEAAGCRVISTVTQNIDSGTLTPLAFDTEVVDTDDCWDVAAPTQLVAGRDGYYLAGGGWELAAGQNTAASRHLLIVRRNGVDYLATQENHTVVGKTSTVVVTTGMIWLSAGDYVELVARHDEGATKTASAASLTSQDKCHAWLMRVG